MNTAKKISGVAIAAAAATMFALAPMSATAGGHKAGKCTGINSIAAKEHLPVQRLLLPVLVKTPAKDRAGLKLPKLNVKTKAVNSRVNHQINF